MNGCHRFNVFDVQILLTRLPLLIEYIALCRSMLAPNLGKLNLHISAIEVRRAPVTASKFAVSLESRKPLTG